MSVEIDPSELGFQRKCWILSVCAVVSWSDVNSQRSVYGGGCPDLEDYQPEQHTRRLQGMGQPEKTLCSRRVFTMLMIELGQNDCSETVRLEPERLNGGCDGMLTDCLGTASDRILVASSQDTMLRSPVCYQQTAILGYLLLTEECPVLLQAMKQEPPLDQRCRDKFLVQSVAITSDKEFTNVSQIVGGMSRLQNQYLRSG
jgi:hypothetical protein